jgi:Short C-terminal domain
MALSEEIQKLDELRRKGTLSPEEFEIAKRRVLEASQYDTGVDHLEEIKAQNELAQIDREWGMERENYMVTGKYGRKYIPDKVSSVFGGIFAVGVGIFWMAMTTSITGFGGAGVFSPFPLFGVLFILFGVGASFWSFVQAELYEEAQERYQRRRREILTKIRKP